MHAYLPIAGIICLVFLVASCRVGREQPKQATEPAKQARDVAAVKRIAEAWDDGWRTGDASALAALFTDDAVLMPQNQSAIIGRESIQSVYRAALQQFEIRGSGEVLEIEVAGDWAFYRSSYTLTATPKGGGELTSDTGKAVHILKRQRDNSWKIARLIANSDLSLPGS